MIIFLLAIGATSAAVLARQVRGGEDVKTIDVIASRFQFEPETISVVQGDSVRLRLHSADRSHAFAIKAFRVKAVIPKRGETVTVEFVAEQAGTFAYHLLRILRYRPCRDEGQAGRLGEEKMIVFDSPAGATQVGSRCVVRFSMRVLAASLCLVAVSAVAAVVWWRTANIGPVQRGADLAVDQGCLGCHGGPGVSPLLPRPFAELDDVDPATLREWILDGMSRRVRQDPESRKALEAAAIRMPAWRGRLSRAQVDDLVAYVRALPPPMSRRMWWPGTDMRSPNGSDALAATDRAGVARAVTPGA